ncbi:MAG: DNA-directed RNA polymerase subunit omega [Bernardetiaceae bacterium]
MRRNLRASLVTRDMSELTSHTGNVYEAIVAISKRARHVATLQKDELSQKISEFATSTDSLEEVFENKEQIEISRHYERLPKPSTTATEELLDGDLILVRPKSEEDLELGA